MKGEKNHTIISTDVEKLFDRIQHPFLIKKTLNKLQTEGKYLNIRKPLHEKPRVNSILNDKRMKAFPLRSGTRQ